MSTSETTQCCVAGGGPAGLMLGYLLARAGVRVTVLEKHADFLRDFRGDTVHPSTLEVMRELGLLDRLLQLPHTKVERLMAKFGDTRVLIGDFSYLPVQARYIAMMPQWDFLSFLASEGKRYPGFKLMMQAEATGLIEEGDRVTGLTAKTANGPVDIKADLVVAADGRGSVLRDRSGLHADNIGAPMDVLWFRLSRKETDPPDSMGSFDFGRILVLINRTEYWQLAFVIPKGGIEQVRAKGLEAFRAAVVAGVPFTADRVNEITSWDDVKLLTVRVDRLANWYRPGLLVIGDAAHAMSPIGGVGINLAVQDAVAAANVLVPAFAAGGPTTETLRAVQKRRGFPTRVTQKIQVIMQNNVIAPALAGAGESGEKFRPPALVRAMAVWPVLSRLPARLFGMGVRPEHVSQRIIDAGR